MGKKNKAGKMMDKSQGRKKDRQNTLNDVFYKTSAIHIHKTRLNVHDI